MPLASNFGPDGVGLRTSAEVDHARSGVHKIMDIHVRGAYFRKTSMRGGASAFSGHAVDGGILAPRFIASTVFWES